MPTKLHPNAKAAKRRIFGLLALEASLLHGTHVRVSLRVDVPSLWAKVVGDVDERMWRRKRISKYKSEVNLEWVEDSDKPSDEKA